MTDGVIEPGPAQPGRARLVRARVVPRGRLHAGRPVRRRVLVEGRLPGIHLGPHAALAGYEMQVARVSYADGVGFAELAETVEVDGTRLRTPECLSFTLTDDGRISRVEVFTQTRAPA